MNLTGKRISIRPFTAADAAAYWALAQDPAVAKPAGIRPLADLEQAQAHLAQMRDTEFAVVYQGAVVGQVGVYPRTGDPSAPEASTREVGYALAQAYWGQGLMTEAMRLVLTALFAAGITAVWAGTWPENRRSIALLARLGFDYRFTAPIPRGLQHGGSQFEAYFAVTPTAFEAASKTD